MLDTSTYHHRIKNCNNTLYSLFKLIASKATVNDYIVSSFYSLTTFVGLNGIGNRLITIFRSFHTHFHASGNDLNDRGTYCIVSGVDINTKGKYGNIKGDDLNAVGHHLNAKGVSPKVTVTQFKFLVTHFYASGTLFHPFLQYLQLKNTFFQYKKSPELRIITHLKKFVYHLKFSGTFLERQRVFLHFFRHFIQVKFSFVETRMT